MVSKKQSSKKIPKKAIKKILVPLDGSKNSFRALEETINLAKYTESQIVGIYVIPSDISSLPLIEIIQPLSSLKPAGFQKRIIKYGEKIIAKAKEICMQNKIRFSGQVIKGNPGSDIVKFSNSKKNKIGMIVIGSRGKGPTTEILLGSVSNYVIHKAKSPVMIVK
ncbi:universal stress protein [Nitrosopumilus sp. K4]|uniref:universal stress protein n=1 Tax=Nitrosopumilus sp. K4 TaxID=2795383 RepID=UPI001BA44D23|nr:universal stress protein [Nitrosopumilus sp. K4]QUC64758.1 universal stress protein [Nitrosopumilus sp. K4]